MATFSNNESNLSVRNKINAVLQHSDGTSSELVINEAGADVDFRVESDTNANALFVEGSTGNVAVGAGTINPIFDKTFQVGDGTTAASISLLGTGAATTGDVFLTSSASTATLCARASTDLILATDDVERLRILANGNIGIGTASPADSSGFGRTLDVAGGVSSGAAIYVRAAASATNYLALGQDTSNNSYITNRSSGGMFFSTDNTERMRIDTAGNVGISVVPSAWVAGSQAVQIGSSGYTALSQATGGDGNLTSNAYLSAVGVWRSIATVGAVRYQLDFGAHRWFNAPSVTAGSVLTFAERMVLDAAGNLGVGTVSPLERLHVNTASGAAGIRISVSDVSYGNLFSSASGTTLNNTTAAPLMFGTTNTERMRIDASGNLLIGTSASGASKLRISGLPTSSSGLSTGDVWNDGGTLKIA
jgi:hypothetical protein